MSDKSLIEWTDASWNPIRATPPMGRHLCLKVSPGCDFCYAGRLTHRYGGLDYLAANTASLAATADMVAQGAIRLDAKTLEQPLHWRAPRRIFVCSMTDIFGEWVPVEWMSRIWDVMAACPQHTFQVLTKRPKRMHVFAQAWVGGYHPDPAQRLPEPWCREPLPNVWLGVTVESDAYTWRANVLREVPAAVRFVSAEPLLGPLYSLDLPGIDWLIVGGESGGPLERRLISASDQSASWARDLRDRAQAAGTAFFFKQWGGTNPKSGGRLLDGREWSEYPTPRVAVPA